MYLLYFMGAGGGGSQEGDHMPLNNQEKQKGITM